MSEKIDKDEMIRKLSQVNKRRKQVRWVKRIAIGVFVACGIGAVYYGGRWIYRRFSSGEGLNVLSGITDLPNKVPKINPVKNFDITKLLGPRGTDMIINPRSKKKKSKRKEDNILELVSKIPRGWGI